LVGDNFNSFVWVNSYLFTADEGQGTYLSTDSGQTWSHANNGIPTTSVMKVASTGNYVFAGTYTSGFFLSTDSGAHWRQKNNGLTHLDVLSIATSGNKIFIATSGGVYLSTDTGSTWNFVSNGLNLSSGALAYIVTNGNMVFTGDRALGIHVSFDDGAHWYLYNNGLTNTSVWSLAISQTNLYAGTQHGFFKLDLATVNSTKDLVESESTINIYPNPVEESFNVSMDDYKSKARMEIFNTIGEVVYTAEITQPLSAFRLNASPGIYVVKISSNDRQYTKKIVLK
jgi:photosystem II stability/assembly factor-like uncharacterized protein